MEREWEEEMKEGERVRARNKGARLEKVRLKCRRGKAEKENPKIYGYAEIDS